MTRFQSCTLIILAALFLFAPQAQNGTQAVAPATVEPAATPDIGAAVAELATEAAVGDHHPVAHAAVHVAGGAKKFAGAVIHRITHPFGGRFRRCK